MPINVTDSISFTTPIQSVATGDSANQANFLLAPQGLANRTAYLNNALTTGDGSLVAGALTITALTKATAIAVTTALSFGTNPATTGALRAANNTTIATARNAANTQNIPLLGTDASDNVNLGDSAGAQGALTVLNGTTGLSLKVAATQVGSLAAASGDFLKLGVAGGMPSVGYIRFGDNIGGSPRYLVAQNSIAGEVDLIQADGSNGLLFGTGANSCIVDGLVSASIRAAGAYIFQVGNAGSLVSNAVAGWNINNAGGPWLFAADSTCTEFDFKINSVLLASITPSKFVTSKGLRRALVTKSADYVGTTSDDIVIFTVTAKQLTLPASPAVGDKYTAGCNTGTGTDTYKILSVALAIKFQGITQGANTALSLTVSNGLCASFVYDGTQWVGHYGL